MDEKNRGLIMVVVLLLTVLLFGCQGSDRPEAAVPTATEVTMEATVTDAPEAPEPESPTATVAEEPTEEPTEAPTQEPTPTEEPTEEPPVVLPPEPQEIEFEADDGQALQGRYYPAASGDAPLIILMHWAPGTMDDWNEIAFWLQNRGLSGTSPNVGQSPWLDPTWFPALAEAKSYAVFTFDFRDGGSREQLLLDAQAAFKQGRELEGINPNQIASFGASIGADGAPDGCFWHNENFGPSCLGALSFSPGSYLTVPYNEAVDKLGAQTPPKPTWCFYATDDNDSAAACSSAIGDHYRIVEWQGGRWHGMELIDPARDPNALVLVLEWLDLLGL